MAGQRTGRQPVAVVIAVFAWLQAMPAHAQQAAPVVIDSADARPTQQAAAGLIKATAPTGAVSIDKRALLEVLAASATTPVHPSPSATGGGSRPAPAPSAAPNSADPLDPLAGPPRAPIREPRPSTRPSTGSTPAVSAASPTPEPAPAPPLVRVPLALERVQDTAPLKSMKVVSGSGRIAFEASGAPVLEQDSAGTTVISSALAGEIAEHSELGEAEKTGLPWMVVDVQPGTDRAGGEPGMPAVRAARPFLWLARAVQWQPADKRYVAELLVGLDPEKGVAPGPLHAPVVASVSATCEDITPARLSLAAIGPEGDQRVRVSCSPARRADEGGKQTLTVRLPSGQLTYPFTLPATPGPYSLASSATEIVGFGFSSVSLTVVQAHEDGSPLVATADTTVLLRSTTGDLHPSELTIRKGDSSASTEVRVFGVGAMAIEAGIGARASAPLALQRSWPIAFAVITALFGALGGMLATLRMQGSQRKRVPWQRRVIEGGLTGSLAVAALLTTPGLAIALPDLSRSELAWGVASALAGYVGVELIEQLAQRFWPSNKAAAS